MIDFASPIKNVQTDEPLRIQALDATQSYIVQAPAGSGKTTLLVARFLSLLAHENVPESCLALTFTKKAAFEMRERILQTLEKVQANEPPKDAFEKLSFQLAEKVLLRDKHLNWDLLDNPHRLKVQTIDALSAEIASSMPLLSQISGEFSIHENPYDLYRKAARNLLKALEGQSVFVPALIVLLRHLDNHLELVERLLATMLAARDQWLPHIGQSMSQSMQSVRHILERGLENVALETLESLKNAQQKLDKDFDDILEVARFAANQLLGARQLLGTKIDNPYDLSDEFTSSIIYCEQLFQWPGTTTEDLKAWQGLTELFLTNSNTIRKMLTEKQGFPSAQKIKNKEDKAFNQMMKERMLGLLEKVSEYPEFVQGLQTLQICPPLTYSESSWGLVEALVTILPVLVAELKILFQEEGQFDFPEIAMAAERALGAVDDPSDLALSLDYKIRHILVDEFQDTSVSQLRLLEQLVAGFEVLDGRTLFLVGDPMQSIYRFRRAEVSLFLKVKEQGLGGVSLTPLTLTSNFRSDPQLIQWTNEFFTSIFPSHDDMASGAIRFSASHAKKEEDPHCRKVWEVSKRQEQASKIKQFIEEAKTLDPEGSMALLVRSRMVLKDILPELQQFGIDYQAIELESLIQRPMIMDLLSLSRALVHLADRTAWLALLRGPWCGLSLKDLFIVADFEPRYPLCWTLEKMDKMTGLSEDGKRSLESFMAIVMPVLLERERCKFSDWIFKAWSKLQDLTGLATNLSEEDESDCKSFFSHLRTYEHQLDFYNPGVLELSIRKLSSKPKTSNQDVLQVLTIHKAKGLEFDSVIIAGLGRRSRYDQEKLFLWEERPHRSGDPYLLLAPIKAKDQKADPIYHYLKNQEHKRLRFEEQRLLYVAMTRARRRLYLLTEDENFTNSS